MPTYANSRLTTSNFARQRPRLYLLLFSKDPSKAGNTASLLNWLGHIILDTSRIIQIHDSVHHTHTHIDKWPKLLVAVHGWWSIIARQPPKPPLSRHPGEKQPTHRKQFDIQKEGIRKVRSTLINDQPRVNQRIHKRPWPTRSTRDKFFKNHKDPSNPSASMDLLFPQGWASADVYGIAKINQCVNDQRSITSMC